MSEGFLVRNYPPPVDPGELNGIDLVLCTHDHLDHTDPESLCAIATASPHCRFAGPASSIAVMKKAGIDETRLTMMEEGAPFDFKGAVIEPVAAAHEVYETDPEGHHKYLSYLIRWEGLSLFHAGDSVVTPEQRERLSREKIDVGFLPVNGRSEERHKHDVIGNMNAEEAAAFACALNFDLVVPTHYDLYACNGAALADLARAWESLPMDRRPKLKAFLPGERMIYGKADRPRELAVMLGAGKTGRGFLARLLAHSAYDVMFVDRSEKLVRLLNEDGGYSIHFFGGVRPPFQIGGVAAALPESETARDWMVRASLILTAVAESNIAGLAPGLGQVLDERRRLGRPKLEMLVCENGVSPAAPLRKAFADRTAEIAIAEAAIFCSTIELPGTRLDVQSEAYDALPYDAFLSGLEAHDFPALKAVADFPVLLRRKIYTYNCFSACIAYLGACKGYKWYADAAGDAEIGIVLEQIAEPLNRAIAESTNVELEEQRRFSEAALSKFRNREILDDIPRNARDVARKLAPNDRLIEPARLILERGGRVEPLALVIAAALLYQGPGEEALQERLRTQGVEKVFAEISGCGAGTPLNRLVARYYGMLSSSPAPSLAECLIA